jgi:hypothetical protein
VTTFPRPNRDASQMIWVRAPISGARWQVHRELAPILSYVLAEAERRGYRFDLGPADVDDDWGYYVRRIADSESWSYHSAGAGIDVDAQNYPQGQNRQVPPRWLIDLFHQWGWSWGGTWSNPDPMHFEFRGTVEQARMFVAMLAASIGKPIPVPPGTPSPVSPTPPNTLGGSSQMVLIDISNGAIWAVSETHMHHLTGAEWATRSDLEKVTPFPVQPLYIVALVNGGRKVI